MKKLIKQVLNELGDTQINLGSEAARETVASLVSAALKEKGSYTEHTDSEIKEQEARATWVCSICGENTYDVEWDYIGSNTNHLGCELKSQEEIDEYIEDIDEQAYAQGRGSSHRVGDDIAKALGHMDKDGNYITEPDGDRRDKSDDRREKVDRRKGDRREKNWSQKKHENKVFNK
jgi:hypothetical protein